MQRLPALPEEERTRSKSVDERTPLGVSPIPSTSEPTGTPRRHSTYSPQQDETAILPRQYEFVGSGELPESRRKRLRQHVMHDYMHRRRTLAAMGPTQETGRLVGWRNVDSSNKDAAFLQVYEDVQSRSYTPGFGEPSTPPSSREKLPLHKSTTALRIRSLAKGDKVAKHSHPSPISSSLASTPQPGQWWEETDASETAKSEMRERPQSPGSRLGAGLIDPFNSLPVAVTSLDQALINHYLNTLPYIQYQMSSAVDYNPHKLLFHEVLMHDAAALQAVLALASKHMVTGLSGKQDTVKCLAHKTRTIELVNQRLQSPATAVQDGTIYAVGALSVIEKWADDYEAERAHYRGLSLLIKERGGIKEIRKSNRFLEAAVYWVEFSRAPGPNTIGSLPFSGATPDDVPSSFDFLTSHLAFPLGYSAPPSSPMRETPGEIHDLLLACEQFLSFFHELFSFYQEHGGSRYHAIRSAVFHPDSILTKVLAESPWQNVRAISGNRYHKDLCWMGSLLFVNFALWDFSNQPERLEHYLSWLENEARLKCLGKNHSVETLLWIFWKDQVASTDGPGDLARPGELQEIGTTEAGRSGSEKARATIVRNAEERNWFVTRLLRVAKRLSAASWGKVRDTLLAFLLASEDDTAVEVYPDRPKSLGKLPWDDDEFRREILGALYLCPPSSKLTELPRVNS